MSKEKEKNCRLCLNILDDDYNNIGEVTREMFEVLLLKVDLSVSEEPVLCKICMENVQEAYYFKSTCISVNKQVVSLARGRNSGDFDMRDVYLNENENKTLVFNEDYNVCRFCLQCVEKSNFNLLNDLKKNSADEMLYKCIPELDLDITKEPVACATCMKSLENYYSFAIKCWNVEENIMKYCGIQGIESNGHINLSNVLEFLCKGLQDSSKTATYVFQNERDTFSDINNVCKIEEEEFIIKDEKNGDFTFARNKCVEIKGKEVVEYDKDPLIIIKDNEKLTMHKCNLCSYETKRKNYLTKHMLTHKDSSDVVMNKCEKCTYETKYKSNLRTHMLIHKDYPEGTTYKCSLCSYETKRKDYLKNHMLTHKDSSDVVIYRCTFCTFETKHKASINRHVHAHKYPSETRVVTYKCETCTFKTKFKYSLKLHMLIHKNKEEMSMYKCDLCSYEAKRKDYLTSHMSTHKESSEVVMNRCKMCTYETKYKSNLITHMLTHKDNSETTMYKCSLCSYGTKRKDTLKNHMLSHKKSSDVVMFKCALCTFETKYRGNLKKHMVIHKDS